MLVLTRLREEHVVIHVPPSTIPRKIEVMVVSIRNGRCRLGFSADRDVHIVRGELEQFPFNAKAAIDGGATAQSVKEPA